MNFVEELIKEESALVQRLELVRATIKAYGAEASESNKSNINPGAFPTKARTDKQLLWIFENSLSKGLKLKELQEKYNSLLGNDSVNIDNVARRLKREGKLVIVKYNDKNLLSYWGLPSWIDGDNFKEVHLPDAEALPEITSSHVFRE